VARQGMATVSGAGSAWKVAGLLSVGEDCAPTASGKATLAITNGGLVSDTTGYIATTVPQGAP